jgi:hypothetical protein
MEFLSLAIYVATIGVVAGAISWVLRRFGKTPSFILCCAIAVCLVALLATFIATYPWRGTPPP